MQQRQVAKGVHIPGAARAAILPLRGEHEMVYDELATAVEQVDQALLSFRAVEDIVLLDPHHRQPPPLGGHAVAVLGKLLLVLQMLDTCCKPFVARHNRWMRYVILCHGAFSSL